MTDFGGGTVKTAIVSVLQYATTKVIQYTWASTLDFN